MPATVSCAGYKQPGGLLEGTPNKTPACSVGLLHSAPAELWAQTQEAQCLAFMPKPGYRIWQRRPGPVPPSSASPPSRNTSFLLVSPHLYAFHGLPVRHLQPGFDLWHQQSGAHLPAGAGIAAPVLDSLGSGC